MCCSAVSPDPVVMELPFTETPSQGVVIQGRGARNAAGCAGLEDERLRGVSRLHRMGSLREFDRRSEERPAGLPIEANPLPGFGPILPGTPRKIRPAPANGPPALLSLSPSLPRAIPFR